MLAAFGVDVLDPAVSNRRVNVLLRRLPPTVRRGGEEWSTEAELLASLVDHVAALAWITVKAHSKKGANVPRPPLVPRPKSRVETSAAPRAEEPGTVKHGTWGEAAAALAGMPGMTRG